MIFIHVGKGKTGTSYLQDVFFSSHEEINFLGKTKHKYPQWLIEWHYLDDIQFKKEIYNIKNVLNKKLSTQKVNILSSEAFSMVGYSYQQALRIKQIVPDAKIILTLRNPIDSIESFYKYSVLHDNFTSNIEDLIEFTRTPMVFYKRKPIYIADFFYDEIIEIYHELFGKSNVLILKYEDMKNNPNKFFNNLSNFLSIKINMKQIKKSLQIKVNTSPSSKEIFTIKQLNNFQQINSVLSPNAISLHDIPLNNDSTIITDDLKVKLEQTLKGKCFGYY